MLNYRCERRIDGGSVVTLEGDITLANSRVLLETLWNDPNYTDARYGIWDVSACELPDIETILGISKFISERKSGRGPALIAFVSPAFAQKMVTRVYRGFERVHDFNLNFLTTLDDAETWISVRLPDGE